VRRPRKARAIGSGLWPSTQILLPPMSRSSFRDSTDFEFAPSISQLLFSSPTRSHNNARLAEEKKRKEKPPNEAPLLHCFSPPPAWNVRSFHNSQRAIKSRKQRRPWVAVRASPSRSPPPRHRRAAGWPTRAAVVKRNLRSCRRNRAVRFRRLTVRRFSTGFLVLQDGFFSIRLRERFSLFVRKNTTDVPFRCCSGCRGLFDVRMSLQ